MIYLNYAALCPVRPEVERETAATLRELSSYLYSEPGLRWYEQTVKKCRESVAGLLGVPDPGSIAFVPNASTAHHLICCAISWPSNSHVLASTHENPSILRTLRGLGTSHGVHVHLVNPISPEGLVAEVTRLVEQHPVTAMVFSHVSHVDGRIFPIAEIGEVARHHQVLLIIDGAQAVGHIPVDLSHWLGDAYFFSGHKWCRGPLGTGALVMHEHFVELNPLFGLEQREQGQSAARAFEIGTHNIGLIAGLAKACRLKGQEWSGGEPAAARRAEVKSPLAACSSFHIQEWEGPQAPGILSFRCGSARIHEKLCAELAREDIVVKIFADGSNHEVPLIRLSWLEPPSLPPMTSGNKKELLSSRRETDSTKNDPEKMMQDDLDHVLDVISCIAGIA